MANTVYPLYRKACLDGNGPNLGTADIKAVLVDTNGGTPYTYNAAHEFLTSVPAGSRLGTTGNLASKTTTGGVFDAADIALPDAGGGATGEALVLYVDTGTEGTSRLLAYIDSATGLPITLDGVEDSIQWHASGIFAL